MSEKLSKTFGDHYLVELIGCEPDTLKYVRDVKSAFNEAAKKSGAVILGDRYHQFDPVGVTGVILIAESHFSVHTWPEEAFAAFDVLTCGEMNAEVAVETLRKSFKAKRVIQKIIPRGF